MSIKHLISGLAATLLVTTFAAAQTFPGKSIKIVVPNAAGGAADLTARTVGVQLGEGRNLSDIVAEMNMVAEGVKSTEAVLAIAQTLGLELPVAEFVGQVLYLDAKAADLVPDLMLRSAKSELDGIPS